VTINVPITNGRLALGTWQGIYLNEHRYCPKSGGRRSVVITLQGERLRESAGGGGGVGGVAADHKGKRAGGDSA
jgi:hypothetical protein